MECVIPWKFPLLPQHSVKPSVVFERRYRLVIKYNRRLLGCTATLCGWYQHFEGTDSSASLWLCPAGSCARQCPPTKLCSEE
jgi:hypothetical protein